VCRHKQVEDDRVKVCIAEEKARVNELRTRSRAGKERHARISDTVRGDAPGMARETMDDRGVLISKPKKMRRRKRLRKHKAQWTDIRQG
jgi:hypothetical protein